MMDNFTEQLELEKKQFVMQINRRFPKIKILKVADLMFGNFIAIVQEGDGQPFIIGKRHGHIVPVKREVLMQAWTRHKKALDDVRGAMDILHVYDPKDPEKWKNLLATLGVEVSTSD